MAFDDSHTYTTYRQAVRNTYGAELSDMNYLGIGVPGWQARYTWFRDWLFRAAPYGDPTIAVEPLGPDGFGVFRDSPEMQCLRLAFQQAGSAGITVWVRFASESNDAYNHYSIRGSSDKIAQYRAAVHWFRAYMPSNVRLVFSPLLNDFFMKDKEQMPTLAAMYEPGQYDRIGGTLYATTQVRIEPTFDWYYNHMHQLDPNTRFQICELGGTFSNAPEVSHFVLKLKGGKWPMVDRVNLFGGELNPVAIKHHGNFGLVLPGTMTSYLRPIIAAGSPGPHPALAQTQWHSSDMTIEGRTLNANSRKNELTLNVTKVIQASGKQVTISPARKKTICLLPATKILSPHGPISALQLTSLKGATLRATGWDRGSGTALQASSIAVQAN
jgi:hypothetical protein